MLCSRESFEVKLQHYKPLPEDRTDEGPQIDLEKSDCQDLTKNHSPVKSDKVRQNHSKRLVPLYAKTPWLTMSKIQYNDTWGEPKVITKQCLLVAWEKDLREFCREHEKESTFFTNLWNIYPQRSRRV